MRMIFVARSLHRSPRRFIVSAQCSFSMAALTIPTKQDRQELFRLMNERPKSVISDDSTLEKYNRDWTNKYRGQSSCVVRPQSSQEVSSILKYCNSRKIGVVPQGGNTGLVGGSVPIQKEIVLSVEKLGSIQTLDPLTGILQCESGCILQDLQEYAKTYNHLVPVDLGAKGTCQIGGNVSTNAGGSYYYRYGSLHANVMGLEVVLANGDILNLGYDPPHLKDNTGYDLKHLFVGAEGTLGVVTKVALLCPQYPKSKCAALLACDSFDQVMETLKLAKSCMGEILAAFEFMDSQVLKLVQNVNPDALTPLSSISHPYYILVETHGSDEEHDQTKMEYFLETVMGNGTVVDGVLGSSLSQIEEFWKLRESCNPSCAASGYVYKYDVSLPIPEFPTFIADMKHTLSDLENHLAVVNWGHVIDGNLHLNIVSLDNFGIDSHLSPRIESLVLDQVARRGGSISAEHGLGQYKSKHMNKIKDPETLSKMRSIKELFDPNGILNPGKYLP